MVDPARFNPGLSIRNRLLLQLGVVAFVISISLFLLARQVIVQAVTATQDGLLNAAVQSIVDKITVIDGTVSLDLPYDTFSLLGAVGEDRIFYRIAENDRFLTGYEDFPYDGVFGDLRAPVFGNIEYLGETFRFVAIENILFSNDKPQRLTIIIAQSQNFQASVQTRISNNLLLVSLAFLLIAILVAYLTANLTIRPIDRFTMDVKQRGPTDLRKVSADVPIELLPLAQSLNGFISRFRSALRQTETFIAEAAHHIRTPLSVVKSESELALRKSKNPENREHLRNIIQAVDWTNRSATQLLDHAMVLYRIERPEKAKLSLQQTAGDLVSQFQPVAALRDLDLRFSSDVSIEEQVLLDRTLLEAALRNLLDNALKYAKPESGVNVSLTRADKRFEIAITNWVSRPESLNPSKLLKKFKRGENTENIVGSGLGLSIVTEAAHAIGAKFTIRKIKRGGICAVLSIAC